MCQLGYRRWSASLRAPSRTEICPISLRCAISFLRVKMVVQVCITGSEMTLILSAISQEVVVMVADRRLTYLDRRIHDNATNKLVVYNDTFAFGYSGLATIEGHPVDHWLARGLRAYANLNDALQGIAKRATRVFAILPRGIPRHQAFVGVGWVRTSEADLEPVWVCISNAWDHEREEWLTTPNTSFAVTGKAMRQGRRWLMCPAIGARVTSSERAQAHANVRPALKRRAHGIPAARLLGDITRAVSQREITVGDKPTCVVLPQPQPSTHHRFLMPPVAAAGRVPGPLAFDLVGQREPIRWNPPIVVSPGMMLVPEIELGSDGRFVSMRTKAIPAANTSERPEVGIGVTDGKKESFISMGKDGVPVVRESVVGESEGS